MTCLECGRLCEGSYCARHARAAQERRLRAVAARYGRRHEEKRRAAIGSGGRWEGLRRLAAARQDGRCALCGWPLGPRFEVDHIVPVALGGSSAPENLRALHPECHRAAGAGRGRGKSLPGKPQDRAGGPEFSRGQDGVPPATAGGREVPPGW